MSLDPKDVAAVVVTRGDVSLAAILESWHEVGFGQVSIWDNSVYQDRSVFGRWIAAKEAKKEIVYTQDDDCVLPPASLQALLEAYEPGVVVSNTPERFRDRYVEHCLVGFGAIFDRDLVEPAFERFFRRFPEFEQEWMWPRSDVVFTALNERRLLDLPYEDLPWAHADNRMWKQAGHGPQRETMLGLALAAKLPAND
jgi:hypothetical protein